MPSDVGRPRWFRHVILPAAGYLAVGAALLLTAPLGAARHFYPDVGWAVTILVWLTLSWGVMRLVLSLAVLRRSTARNTHDLALC